MATFRRCTKCGQLFEGRTCKPCAAKYGRKRQSEHEALKLYSKSAWQKCRINVRAKYMDYDIWLLGIGELRRIDGRVFVHHIYERDDRPDLVYDLGNLISVSGASHSEIHEAYITNRADAIKRIQRGLAEFRRLFG